jgi:hypothetical protein
MASDPMPPPQSQAEADFVGGLTSLALEPPPGVGMLNEVPSLLARAEALGQPSALRAVHSLAAALVPLYEALGHMTTGFPVFLFTDLESHGFVHEPLLIDFTREGVLPPASLVIRVDEHINAVLESLGRPPLPVRHRAQDVQDIEGKAVEDKERTVLRLLRTRDFDRMVIEPKRGGYRIEIETNVSVEEEAEVENLLKQHDYQSITVKRQDGKIVRVTQAVSVKVPRGGDGETPNRTGRKRKSTDG